jgi:hypothetical protein
MSYSTSWKKVSRATATGGTETSYTGYKVHTFTSDGTFTVSGGTLTCDILMVGGGGSSGAEYAGGGGAGGVLWGQSIDVISGGNAVVIGEGGSSPTGSGGFDYTRNDGDNGEDTTAFGVTAIGGGGGDAYDELNENGKDGGSGGGNTLWRNMSPHNDASSSTQTAPNASWTAYGNGGGATSSHNLRAATGGGGAGGAGGVNDSSGNGGVGGIGVSTLAGLSSTETAALLWSAQKGTNSSNALVSGLGSNPGTIYIAGGGGGCTHEGSSTPVAGGAGGGGDGKKSTDFQSYQNADANTGGGGGGQEGYSSTGGAGGSGIVIIRYAV